MRSAFVTGAHGFIGRHVARELSRRGVVVGGLGHGLWPTQETARWGVAHWVNGSVNTANLDLLRHELPAPDVVFHLAGGSSVGASLANPREDFARTVATTADLLEWLRHKAPAARVVLVSSAAVYGNGHASPVAERASLDPYSPYGVHKRLMEELGQSYAVSFGVQVVVARLFSVYGPHLRKQLLWDVCSRLASGAARIELGGSGNEQRDWTSVEDVARALVGVGDRGEGVINIGTGVSTPVRKVAADLLAAWRMNGGQRAELEFTGHSRPGDPFSLVADCTKLQRMGLTCVAPLSPGLESYVRWFRATWEATG